MHFRFRGAPAAASSTGLGPILIGAIKGECFEHRIHGWKTGTSNSKVGLKGCPYSKINIIV